MKRMIAANSDISTNLPSNFDRVIGDIISGIADEDEFYDIDSLIEAAISQIVYSDIYQRDMPKSVACWIQENEETAANAVADWIVTNIISEE